MKRYVWLNLITGEFSNSWKKEDWADSPIVQKVIDQQVEKIKANPNGWHLIEYTCLDDAKFEFYNKMKLR